ncbi:MAG TPA: two-component regulator propeller domain-containing protein [Candidatus Angelobacter sp.]|nr:two-component regulator propeller domain-containing protein [Candidatus Angelobacter sp.]
MATRMNLFLRSVGVCMCVALLDRSASGLDPHKLASQHTHTSWSAKDGIPGPVRAIAQTPDGYLWLGTEAGLYRFDGIHFLSWESSFGEQLLSSTVWALHVARDGSLWIGFASGGISQLRQGRLRNYSPAEGVPSGGIASIVEDGNGDIWAGGAYGFGKLEGGQWRRVGADVGYPAPGIQALLVDHRGSLWVATDGLNFGLSKDLVRRNTILTLAPGAKRFAATGLAVGEVWSMAEAPDGEVWAADTSGPTIRPIKSGARQKEGINIGAESTSLLFDGDSNLWIGLDEGGLRRVADFRHALNVPRDRFGPDDGLSGSLVYTGFKDREGNLWFGTSAGLDRFSENKVTPFSAREGLVPDRALALTSTRDGSIWLISYTRDKILRIHDGRILTSKLPPYSQSDSTRILSLFAGDDHHVWVGGSFKLAHGVDGKFTFVPNAGVLGDKAQVEAITRDAGGGLWLSLVDKNSIPRIWRWREGQWTDFGKSSKLPRFRCRVMYADKLGRVWLGFENDELVVYHNGDFHAYSSKDGLVNDKILTIVGDRSGHVWIGGAAGISRFDQGRFATLTTRNGLPGNSIAGIVEDDDGSFWLAGSLGILRVSPQELEKALESSSYRMHGMYFDGSDGLRGLPRQHMPFPTSVRGADGRLWFATTGGVAVIDPARLPRNLVPPWVMIEAIKADDHTLAPSAGLHLPPNTRNLEIEYAGISLTAPERVRFHYKLEGFDDAWRDPVSPRTATYTNLPPRNYRFRVVACNNDGVWNQEGAVLEFSILPAFYQTNWFLLSCIMAAGCLVWAAYQWRVRRVTARLDSQLQLRLSERTRIAQDLHDTLLQGFLSASMQLHVANDQLPTDSPAKASVTEVLELMSHVTEEGRNALRSLRSSGAEILDLESAFSRIPRELALPHPAAFRVIVEGSPRSLRVVVHAEVYRIGHEALVNAFRHSNARNIEVELGYEPKFLKVLIRDDGDGIDSEMLRSGREGHWGLSGMRERAEKIGARLRILTRASAGTEVELVVPSRVAFDSQSSDGLAQWFFRLYSRKRNSNAS